MRRFLRSFIVDQAQSKDSVAVSRECENRMKILSMRSDNYMVAIHCLAFNHEPYIRDCLEGFVMQKTDFKFVAIVHDDASTDRTAEIIREYEAKYPDIIKPIFETDNQYSKHDGSLDRIMNAAIDATGAQYVAMCEGDDYWTDPLKLQKQVDILEKEQMLMACVTNCSVVDSNGATLEKSRGREVVKGNIDGRYSLRSFFTDHNLYPTCSVVFRNTHTEAVRKKTDIMRNPFLGDWTLWIALHCFGDFYFFNEVTCAYRINPTSVTHSGIIQRRIGLAKENLKLLPAVASVLPSGYEDIQKDLTDNKAWIYWSLGCAYYRGHKFFHAIGCAFIFCIQKSKQKILDYVTA